MTLTSATASRPDPAFAGRSSFPRRVWLTLFGLGLMIAGALVGELVPTAGAPAARRALGQDLLPGYVAGRMVRTGRFRELYNVEAVADCAAQVMREADVAGDPRHAVWINPPFYAWAFVP